MGNTICKVVHVDDHPIFRIGIEYAISKMPGFQLVGKTDNGNSFLTMLKRLKPDVALVDIDLPNTEWNGIELAREVHRYRYNTRLILLSNYITQENFDVANALGVKGFLLKDASNDEIETCLKKVSTGQRFISKLCLEFLDDMCEVEKTEERAPSTQEQFFDFTESEKKIMCLITENMTTEQIAYTLNKSPRTIENHRYRICKKLNISGSNSLLKFVMDNKRYFRQALNP